MMMLLKYFLSRFAALCATDFLFVFIGPSLLYYLLVFPFLSFRSLILSYLFRCALLSDPLFFPLSRFPSLLSSRPSFSYFCVCIHSLALAECTSLVSQSPTFSAPNPYVRAKDNMLWGYGCTVRLLPAVASAFTTSGGQTGAYSNNFNEWFLV